MSSITINIINGTPPYNVNIQPIDVDIAYETSGIKIIDDLSEGDYTLTLTDINNCEDVKNVTIFETTTTTSTTTEEETTTTTSTTTEGIPPFEYTGFNGYTGTITNTETFPQVYDASYTASYIIEDIFSAPIYSDFEYMEITSYTKENVNYELWYNGVEVGVGTIVYIQSDGAFSGTLEKRIAIKPPVQPDDWSVILQVKFKLLGYSTLSNTVTVYYTIKAMS